MNGRPCRESTFALRFFALSAALFGLAAALGAGFVRLGACPDGGPLAFPPAFWLSSLMLVTGSAAVQRAVQQVRIERQRAFRRCLAVALAAGTAFVGFQSAGLHCILHADDAPDFATGVSVFVFLLASLHALHFTVALMFLAWIALRALEDRYDHEYYWGVTLCAYFWHFLGVVWLGILCVFAIITLGMTLVAG